MKKELDLTISAGVSFNKVFAKLGSDLKKPDAITAIPREAFRQIVWPLPARAMIGIGPATEARLSGMGVLTLGQLAQTDRKLLRQRLGITGERLWLCAAGLESSPVTAAGWQPEVKSVGNSVTCRADLQTEEEVWRVVIMLAEEVSRRLREQRLIAGGVQLHIRDCRLAVEEHEGPLPQPCRSAAAIARRAMELFGGHYGWKQPIRSVGIRAYRLADETEGCQFSLFWDPEKEARQERLEASADAIRSRFGKQAVCRASMLLDNKLPGQRPPVEAKLAGNFFAAGPFQQG